MPIWAKPGTKKHRPPGRGQQSDSLDFGVLKSWGRQQNWFITIKSQLTVLAPCKSCMYASWGQISAFYCPKYKGDYYLNTKVAGIGTCCPSNVVNGCEIGALHVNTDHLQQNYKERGFSKMASLWPTTREWPPRCPHWLPPLTLVCPQWNVMQSLRIGPIHNSPNPSFIHPHLP